LQANEPEGVLIENWISVVVGAAEEEEEDDVPAACVDILRKLL